MDKPSPPPEAQLLRLVRTAAGIKAADAAASVAARSIRNFSASRWSQIENGYETRAGAYKPVRANAGTLAHMAFAVGLTPERLETEGQRPDAAEILREIVREPAAGPPAPVAPAPPADRVIEAAVAVVTMLLEVMGNPDRWPPDVAYRQLSAIWDLGGGDEPYPPEQLFEFMRMALDRKTGRTQAPPAKQRNGRADSALYHFLTFP